MQSPTRLSSMLNSKIRSSTPGPATVDPKQLARVLQGVSQQIAKWARGHQVRWLADQSKYKAGVWCRQSGKTRIIALEVVILALSRRLAPDHMQTLVSSSENKAVELLERVRHWTDAIDYVARNAAGFSIYASEPTRHEIKLNPWGYIKSYASNAETLAGNTGDVFLDEVSKIANDEKVYGAVQAMPGSQAEYKFRMTGTPYGPKGIFYDVVHQRGVNASGIWSVHKNDIHQVIRDGDPRVAEQERLSCSSSLWDQDYLLVFDGGDDVPFPPELLKTCRANYERWGKLPTNRPRGMRIALGVDPGETGDKTALVWVAEYPSGKYRIYNVERRHKMPLPEVEAWVRDIIERDGIEKCIIDATGIGAQMAQSLRMTFPHIVTGMKYSSQKKHKMVTGAQAIAQRGFLGMCDDDLLEDFGEIRQRYLDLSKKIQYYSERNERGHSDSAWAALQALYGIIGGMNVQFAVFSDNPMENFGVGGNCGPNCEESKLITFDDGQQVEMMQGGMRIKAPTPAELGFVTYKESDLRAMEDNWKRNMGLLR